MVRQSPCARCREESIVWLLNLPEKETCVAGKMQALRDAIAENFFESSWHQSEHSRWVSISWLRQWRAWFLSFPSFFIPTGQARCRIVPPFCRRARDGGCRCAGTPTPLRRNSCRGKKDATVSPLPGMAKSLAFSQGEGRGWAVGRMMVGGTGAPPSWGWSLRILSFRFLNRSFSFFAFALHPSERPVPGVSRQDALFESSILLFFTRNVRRYGIIEA